MTISSRFLVACLALICSLALPLKASATSASISVSGNEGAITVSASASFSTHIFCSGSGDNKTCWPVSTGSLAVYQNNYYLGGKSGDGSASWSKVLNTGVLTQGQHTFKATASDSKGATDTATETITIDNTPILTVSATDTEGDMDVKGTVDFKENSTGNEGAVFLYLDGYLQGHKYYEGADLIYWTWEEITTHNLNAGTLSQGVHYIRVLTRAANGSETNEYHEFTVDNAPVVTVSATDAEGNMDVKGTVDFKENITGNEGAVFLYLDGYLQGHKYYEGADLIYWTWEEITTHNLNAGTLSQGVHYIRVLARAANGSETNEYHEFTVDNAPVVTVSATDAEGNMDVKGTVDFKENITGNEGAVFLYLDGYLQGHKYYEGADLIHWTWEEITTHNLNAGTLSQGLHNIRVLARAANGSETNEYYEFTVDNAPVVTVSATDAEGNMDVKGTVDFKENITGNEGAVFLYLDGYLQGHKYYEGADLIYWTWEEITTHNLNAGTLSQGLHNIRVLARAANGSETNEYYEFTVDNAPVVTVSAADAEGNMDVKGTVDFKENITGNEGAVFLYLDGYLQGHKYYEGADLIHWTWEEITTHNLNAGTLSQGLHNIRVLARAANGSETNEYHEFTIDNAPVVTVSATDAEGNMDVKGTVDFKENITGNEGAVFLYLDGYLQGHKYYEGADLIHWTWEEITTHNLNAGTLSQGLHNIRVLARAANGSETNEYYEFTVDNAPVVTVSATDAEGNMDVKGTVDFKENSTGNEGAVFLYLDGYLQGHKYYDGADLIYWTWEEITTHNLNAGTLSQGFHNIRVLARAANGSETNEYYEFTVDNAPVVTVSAADAEGNMDVKGTVDFKENITGNEGAVFLYLDGYLQGHKYYEGADLIHWTWEEITTHNLNAGTLSQGLHNIRVLARAANGSETNEYHEFTIDNIPKTTIFGSKYYTDETFDILGTTTFKENITGNEGTIAIYIKEIGAASYTKHGATKTYEGKKICWKYSDFTGARMQKSVWGQKEILIKVVATAANGASASVVKGMVIPALGCPTTFGN